MERLIIILVACLLLSGCYYEDRNITVVTDSDGAYACKYGGSISSIDFETYEEAYNYCVEWQSNYEESKARRNKKWDEAVR